MRLPGTLLAAVLLVAGSATAALACSCARFASAGEQYAQADVMFVGQAEDREVLSVNGPDTTVKTRFVVERTLKGPKVTEIEVAHSVETSFQCGITFEPGSTYLVIAHRQDGQLRTSVCAAPQFSRAQFERVAGHRRGQ
jgi:hypothetical protein